MSEVNFLDILSVDEVKALLNEQINKLALDGYTSELNRKVIVDAGIEGQADISQVETNIENVKKVLAIYKAELERLNTL